ncbi:MAG: LysM peptidoglycan-binding domain-containing protein [Candidatus Omnitrophica bacterium]|nr:LysM peptidoglycan-binding domain-containing protein [Candidatus Omnitrophota bacterium]
MILKRYHIATVILTASLSLFLSSCATRAPKTTDSMISYESPGTAVHHRGAVYHSVAPGETLWRISKMYDVDIETIRKTNRIYDVRDIEIGTRLRIPGAVKRRHVITLYPSHKWKYIIIHHSATDIGNSEHFNTAHLNRGWRGVGYHFVIDNGTCGKDNGQIETSPRWLKQENGAHCKADRMNERGIGICLVGNFSKERVSPAQMGSLVYLVNKLRKYYHIPKDHIIGHGQVRGANTECPGKKFPWKNFYSRLGR